MTKPAHGRSLGVTEPRLREQLRAGLFRRYDADEEFGDALLELIPLARATGLPDRPSLWNTREGLWSVASRNWETEPARRRPARLRQWVAFVAAVDGLARRFGLDLLGDAALDQIFAWCDRYLRAKRSGSLHPSTYGHGRLSVSSPDVYLAPGIDTRVALPWRTETWDPTRETRREATNRLEGLAKERLRAQLDRVESDALAAGLIFPDTAPNQQRDLDWLYRCLRHHESFQSIFNKLDPAPEGGVDTVRIAVFRIVKKVGVDTTGCVGWR